MENLISDRTLRAELEALLQSGLKTEHGKRAYSDEAISERLHRLRLLPSDDYAAKLTVAGFTREPYVTSAKDILQACETCMYYVTNRQFCELPELHMPVKPEWSCTLWRI